MFDTNDNKYPKRKPTRLQGFDYDTTGAYFITICTENRQKILSSIVGEGSPLPQLSHCGKIADKWIRALPEKYKEISVDSYVIMPNHIHLMLIAIMDDNRNNSSTAITAVIGWLKYQITKEINEKQNTIGQKIFQRSFHDHIIRNLEDYKEISKYIYENPFHWLDDCFYTL